VAGITGIVLVLGGLVLTWAGNEPSGLPGILPSLQGTRDALQRGLIVVVLGLTCSLFLWMWLQRYLPKLPYVNKLILTTTSGNLEVTNTDLSGAIAARVWPAVGTIGTAITDLRPAGSAEFHDDTVNDVRVTDVVSDGAFIRAGTRVTVRESTGNRVLVRAHV
jgi:membrane-bound serine protease (ClpP class)